MATVTRENIGTLHDKVTVKLVKEDYLPGFEKKLKQYAKTAAVPGFRKGMVPTSLLRKMYGQSLFMDEVLHAAGHKLEDYLAKEKLAIFAQPMAMPLDSLKLDMNVPADVDFAFEIGLKPEFEVNAVNSAPKITRYKVEVSDKMVDDEVQRTARRYGKVEDREVVDTKEDIVYSTYESSDANGNVAAESQKTEDTVRLENLPLKLQDMLLGKKAGDTVVFRPSDVATADELDAFLKDPLKQGPEAANNYYKLTITKVGFLVGHELNAELFAQVFPNAAITDEAGFKTKVREELSREFERISRDRVDNEIFEILVHNTNMQLPVPFLKRWMKEGGEKPKTEQEVESEFGSFDHQLRWTLISDKLIQDNQIQVTQEEVNDDIKARVLSYFGMQPGEDAAWMESYMAKVAKDEKTIDETYRRLLYDKLFRLLETKFSVEEKQVSEEEFYKLPTGHHHH